MAASPEPQVSRLVDHLFRRQYGRMVAGLTRVLGPGNLDMVEDLVQEAMVRALKVWPFQGVPEYPEAWLVQVARNLAIDRVRRARTASAVERELEHWARTAAPAWPDLPEEVADDTLRMMFTCCHPALTPESQVALTLKTLGGFGNDEIARALLSKQATVAQRLTRAKQALRVAKVPFEVPPESELLARLHAVLQVLYLMFNEGYAALRGTALVREELVDEAVRLGRLLVQHGVGDRPQVHALLALMLLLGARMPARTDAVGELLTLKRQDRGLWDKEWVRAGLYHFHRSLEGGELSGFHVEAAIATCHAMAARYEDTDWPAILHRYDQLMEIAPSPVVALNRTVAVAKVHGVGAALIELDELEGSSRLCSYYLLPAARAMYLWTDGRLLQAARCFEQALDMECSAPQRAFLEQRLERCRAGADCDGF